MKVKTLYTLSLLLGCLFFFPSLLFAQKFEIIPFGGYQTSARIQSVKGTFRINDGLNYGASLSIGRAYKIELSYSRMVAPLTYTEDNTIDILGDIAINSYSIGGLLEIFQGDPIVPFVNVSIGGTYYNPTYSDSGTENVMHFSLGSGAKFYLNEHLGIRLQARLLLPVFFEGLLFEEGIPDPGEGISTKIAGVTGDFTAGLAFKF